jgi:hypothetical protein
MKLRSAVMIAPALTLGLLAGVAEAQQHKATRLGNPGTRFAQRLPKKPDDVRVLLRGDKTKADVAAVLSEVGWKGSVEDFDRAAASAEITEVQIAPGTRLPFMASRKNRKPHALVDVLWAGRRPIDAWAFELSSNCVRYRVVTPKACGNFWIEEIGKDTTDPKCAPPPPPPVVSLSAPAEVCVTQPVDVAVTVQNPPSDGRVSVSVQGKELTSGSLSAGSFKATYPGSTQPGTYEVTATSGGVTGRTTITVKPCIPTCAITVTPNPARAGKPITVDLSGSRVAAGVRGGIRTAKLEVVDPKGNVSATYDLSGPNLVKNDLVIKKGGQHTIRAVVNDEANQGSTNTCEAPVDVKGGFPLFLGGYFGKERLLHDDAEDHDDRPVPFTEFARCSPLAGFNIGVQPKLGDNAELELALGVKFPFEDDAHTALFGDLAVNRVLSRGFFGGGVSWWDIGRDSTGVGLLVQGGYDLTADGKWQLVGQTRVPFFNQFDDIDNNYQFWGGIRFRPFSWK